MRVCILESEHFETLPALVDVFQVANDEIIILIQHNYLLNVQAQFSSIKNVRFLTYSSSVSLLKYAYLKSDILVVNTVNVKSVFLSALIRFLNPKMKVVATIHNIDREIIPVTHSLKTKLIQFFIKRFDGYRVLVNELAVEVSKFSTKPVLFLPAAVAKKAMLPIIKKDEIVVAIPGAVQQKRRDYIGLFNFLSVTPLYFKIKLLFLGSCKDNAMKQLLNKHSDIKKCTIVQFDEELSAGDFADYMIKADVLLSPLNEKAFYGKYKTSGVFGDAIMYGKPLFIPHHVSIPVGWEGICWQYTNWNELMARLQSIQAIGWSELEQQQFESAFSNFSLPIYTKRFNEFYKLL